MDANPELHQHARGWVVEIVASHPLEAQTGEDQMKNMRGSYLLLLLALSSSLAAQRQPGHPIGKVTTIGHLLHLELDSGEIEPERLFDLDHRTLRFARGGEGYRVENVAHVWGVDFSPALSGSAAPLSQFKLPFSGKTWDT